MKVRAFLATAAVSLLLAGTALADVQIGWNSYHDDQGAFSVEIPGAATSWSNKQENGVIYHIKSKAGDVFYHVASFDTGMDLSGRDDTRQILDSLRDDVLKSENATPDRERSIQLNGFPGREVAYRSTKDQTSWVTRIYLVKSRIYTVEAANTGSGGAEEIARFFGSFRPATG